MDWKPTISIVQLVKLVIQSTANTSFFLCVPKPRSNRRSSPKDEVCILSLWCCQVQHSSPTSRQSVLVNNRNGPRSGAKKQHHVKKVCNMYELRESESQILHPPSPVRSPPPPTSSPRAHQNDVWELYCESESGSTRSRERNWINYVPLRQCGISSLRNWECPKIACARVKQRLGQWSPTIYLDFVPEMTLY